ncbi:MAG: glycoside hydrolase family 3 protein [Acidobacteria bacterium]|nr:glycoside hydrolase family 3 protein [Acidobacteriota bacterium]
MQTESTGLPFRGATAARRGSWATLTAAVLALTTLGLAVLPAQDDLDPAARRWVEETLGRLTVDEKVGQLVTPTFRSLYTSSDSAIHDDLVALVQEHHVGGMHVFGARRGRPDVLLNPTYSRTVLGQPLAAASLLNRLQAAAEIPLLVTSDFETGVGFRMAGATNFPRAMAFGAAGDPRLAFEAGRITAVEARAIGIHVNFAPVVDVNNNPRNPVINTRSFGENPATVGRLAAAYVEGLAAGGMLAAVKHFPGHGDTDVDSHLDLPVIRHPRERLESVELPPFRAGIAAGAGGVMTAHVALPALDPDARRPATFSEPMATGLLRDELGFDGLVFTDSMRMRAITRMLPPAAAAARAVAAGHDVVLDSPNDRAALAGVAAAVADGTIGSAQLDASVRRILEAKARLGLHRGSRVDLDALPALVGTRAHRAVARAVSERSITLIRDAAGDVPLRTPRDGTLLYLSVLDYPSGWGIGAPSRLAIPELRDRWSDATAIELSDRTPPTDLELVRETAGRYDAVVAGVFVRAASFSGRMDLDEDLVAFLQDLAEDTAERGQPFVSVIFGNPYVAPSLPELPSVLLTYDYRGVSELTAVKAIAGEIPITGRLPVTLGDGLPAGHGLTRPRAGRR